MPDYQKGKIYKLWSPSKNLVYYGSTIETLSSRLSKHKYSHNGYIEGKIANRRHSSFILECEDYKIELVEEYPCNNKQQLLKKEAEYIKNNICINTQIPGRTPKEYMEEHKQQKAEYDKIYTKNNPEVNKQASLRYYYKNRENILEKRKNKVNI